MTRCTAPLRTLSYDLSRDDGLRTRVLALDGDPGWSVENAGPVFTVVVDGVTITGTSPGLRVEGVTSVRRDDGVVDETTRCRYEEHAADAGDGEYAGDVGAAADGLAVGIDWHVRRYPDLPLVETWVSVTNRGRRAVTVERLDSVGLTIPAGRYELLSYTSAWGREFDGDREPLTAGRSIGTLAGRSSHGMHPWLGLVRDDGAVLCGAVAWSGNWVVRFEEAPETAKPSATEETSEGWKPNEGHNEGYIVTGGLHDQGFAKRLRPGETVDAPPVVLALGSDGDLDTTSIALARAARAYWAPRNALAERLPVEWNHWWTYEDHSVDAATFRANVDVAAELGVEVVTLDAGWFGPADASSAWTDVRGDWDQVNTARFPEGIRALADHAHARGLRFGLWCEIEALGPKATLASRRPDFPATRDGEPLGYVCLANPAAWQWAFETLDRLVREFGTDWIKLDFNLDPGLGCDRTDHGHGPGDGLFEHYRGYYRLLDRIRETHPHVVLENCSSGGLRIDLGIMRHTHLTFLSDPDWPEHGLQLLWGGDDDAAAEPAPALGLLRVARPPSAPDVRPARPRPPTAPARLLSPDRDARGDRLLLWAPEPAGVGAGPAPRAGPGLPGAGPPVRPHRRRAPAHRGAAPVRGGRAVGGRAVRPTGRRRAPRVRVPAAGG
jgi:alpha-galactosidase